MNKVNAGIATAYGAAVRGGYTGTYEEFCQEQAHFAENAQAVAAAKAEIEADITEFSEETLPAAVTSVTDEGTRQIGLVQDEGAAQISRVSSAGTAAVQSVEQAGDVQIEAVQQEGASQVEIVQAEGARVLDSIPADIVAAEAITANVEPDLDSPASKNYSVGDILICGGKLYEVTAAIASGEALNPGTNLQQINIEEQLSELEEQKSNKDDVLMKNVRPDDSFGYPKPNLFTTLFEQYLPNYKIVSSGNRQIEVFENQFRLFGGSGSTYFWQLMTTRDSNKSVPLLSGTGTAMRTTLRSYPYVFIPLEILRVSTNVSGRKYVPNCQVDLVSIQPRIPQMASGGKLYFRFFLAEMDENGNLTDTEISLAGPEITDVLCYIYHFTEDQFNKYNCFAIAIESTTGGTADVILDARISEEIVDTTT